MRLTRDEIILVTGILITLVVGAMVKHYRAERRESSLHSGVPEKGARSATSKR